MNKNILKRFFLLFCVMLCVFSLTACSDQISYSENKESVKQQTVDGLKDSFTMWAQDTVQYLNDTSDEDIKKNIESGYQLSDITNQQYAVNYYGVKSGTIEFYNGWVKTRENLGSLVSIDDVSVVTSEKTGELCNITVKATYEKRSCTFDFVVNDSYYLESGAVNPSYTVGEKGEKAIVNTLIGMGTVFVVLIFISFIISLLKYVNVIGKKKTASVEKPADKSGVDNAIAQIVSSEENEADDLELVAVITAAIAASEGTSSDGLVVRSIKRRF